VSSTSYYQTNYLLHARAPCTIHPALSTVLSSRGWPLQHTQALQTQQQVAAKCHQTCRSRRQASCTARGMTLLRQAAFTPHITTCVYCIVLCACVYVCMCVCKSVCARACASVFESVRVCACLHV